MQNMSKKYYSPVQHQFTQQQTILFMKLIASKRHQNVKKH